MSRMQSILQPKVVSQPAVVSLGMQKLELPSLVTLLEQATRSAGARLVTIAQADKLVTTVDTHFPILILLNIQTADPWAAAVRRCKARPHSSAIPIYALGNLADEAQLQAARQAGVDQIWSAEKFTAKVPALIACCVNPPITYLAGWDDALPDLARRGLEEFNRGAYFEQHELLEEAWLAETRPIRQLYQGILQIGVAFLQIERQNWSGAIKMLRRGLPKLRTLPPACQGVQLASFRQAAEAIHHELMALGAESVAEFDSSHFPQILYDGAGSSGAIERISHDEDAD